MFQITLDGNHEQHNKIKFTKSNGIDAFLTTINNIHRIQNNISNSLVHVRINFDSTTLNGFDEILERIIDLDRKRTKIILKRSGKWILILYPPTLSTTHSTNYLTITFKLIITVRRNLFCRPGESSYYKLRWECLQMHYYNRFQQGERSWLYYA